MAWLLAWFDGWAAYHTAGSSAHPTSRSRWDGRLCPLRLNIADAGSDKADAVILDAMIEAVSDRTFPASGARAGNHAHSAGDADYRAGLDVAARADADAPPWRPRARSLAGELLVARFESHVTDAPDALALVSGQDTLSRGELWNAAGEAAEKIASVTGDGRRVVMLSLPNSTAWLVAFVAVLRAGHVPATLPVTTAASHLQRILELIEPALAVCGPRHARASADSSDLEHAARAAGVAVGFADATSLSVQGPAGTRTGAADVPDAVAHLMFTSSTTGPPKAVSHSEDSLATLNGQFAERFDLHDHTAVFMPSPLGHSVGAIHGARLSLFLGAALILQDEWHPATAIELVARHGAAFTAAATPFLLDLANAENRGSEPKLASLRTFLCGGAQVPPALIRRCRIEFPNTFVTPLWGMTEGGLTTCVADSTDEQVETTVGIALPDLELRVSDADATLRRTGTGELVMRGPGVFNGYFGQPELYAQHIVGDGFFRTGDLARIDVDGYVTITGRVKDLIIRGAVNISPVETENTIAAHPDVAGVAVVGWPDERLGERLCAVVQATAPLDLDELLAFCERQGLPRRYWPERLELTERFPRTASGKIRKQQLRSDLISRADCTSAAVGNVGDDATADGVTASDAEPHARSGEPRPRTERS